MPVCFGNTRTAFRGGLEGRSVFKKIFHLSAEGSKVIMKASLCMTIFNLATLLPMVYNGKYISGGGS